MCSRALSSCFIDKEIAMSDQHDSAQKSTHSPNPPGNPFAAEAEQRQESMAAESEQHATQTPHIDKGNTHIKQPDKSRNGS
jgi:hypothetical protein